MSIQKISYDLCNTFYSEKKYLKAVICYEKAFEVEQERDIKNLDKVDIYENRANAMRLLNQAEQVLKDYDNKTSDISENAYALSSRAYAKYLLGDYQSALEDINKSISLNQKEAYAFYHRALVYKKLNLIEKAIADIKKAQGLYRIQHRHSERHFKNIEYLFLQLCYAEELQLDI